MIWQLIIHKRIWLNWILFIAFAIGTYFFNLLAPFTGLLLINLFDMYGYDFVLMRNYALIQWANYNIETERKFKIAYRIIQKIFEGLVILFLFVLFGWKVAFEVFFLILFTVQDLIYHYFLEYPLPSTWTWLRWSPLGWIFKDLKDWQVYLQAGFGILLVIILIMI